MWHFLQQLCGLLRKFLIHIHNHIPNRIIGFKILSNDIDVML